jgi:6-pyruvoyltetrahydropterin/6-carboxytetrahydropterin synthase
VGNLAYIQLLHYHSPVYAEVPVMALYTLKVLADFASAHTLRDYPGACSRMHGHNWKVEAEVEADTLNNIGMAIDFKDIKLLNLKGCMDKKAQNYKSYYLEMDKNSCKY